MHNVSFSLSQEECLYHAAATGDLDVIKSAMEDGSVHVNALNDDASTCHIISRDHIDMNYSKCPIYNNLLGSILYIEI